MRALASVRDGLVTALGLVEARRKIRVSSAAPLKVNLGSGLAVAPGWLNLDASLNAVMANLPEPARRLAYRMSGSRADYSMDDYLRILDANEFVFCDLQRGIPLPDACADYVYTSHVLEHLERDQSRALLLGAARVMKPGAVLRVVVPDLAYFVAMYEAGERRRAVDGIFSANAPGRLARHRYMYDEPGLREVLEEAGFFRIVRCEAGRGDTPDLGVLDNRPEESLYMEARTAEGHPAAEPRLG